MGFVEAKTGQKFSMKMIGHKHSLAPILSKEEIS